MRRTLVLATLTVVVLMLASCGGGGGGKVDTDNINTSDDSDVVNLPAQQTAAKFTVQPHQTTTQIVGDMEVTVQAGTFASPTELQITRGPSTATPSDGWQSAEQANCRIEIVGSNQPAKDIVLAPVDPVVSRGAAKVVWFYLTKTAEGAWKILNDVSNITKIVLKPAAFVNRVVDGIVGYVVVSPPETMTRLVQMASFPNPWRSLQLLLGPTTRSRNPFSMSVIIHGVNAQVSDMQLAADMIVYNTRPRIDWDCAVYGAEYDYRLRPHDSAIALAKQINALDYGNVTLWGHSLGAIIVRDMVQHRMLRRRGGYIYLINGPNHGSIWADVADCAKGLDEDFFNFHPSSPCSIIATFDSPVVKDLVHHSDYIEDLNRDDGTWPVDAYYTLIGGSLDITVSPVDGGLNLIDGQNGAEPADIPFDQMLVRGFERHLLLGDHSSLVETESGLNRLLDTLFPQ